MNEFLDTLKNHYADFSGRARRKTYWMFVLFNIILSVAAAVLDLSLGTIIGDPESGIGVFGLILTLALLVPGLAVTVRRIHDLGHSAWFILLFFIPLINFGMLIYMAFAGEEGANKYGPDPKGYTNLS